MAATPRDTPDPRRDKRWQKQLAKVPLSDSVWECDWIALETLLNPMPPLLQNTGVAMLVSLEIGTVVAALPMQTTSIDEVARRLIEAIVRPPTSLKAVRPRLLNVRHAGLRDALRRLAGPALPAIEMVEEFELLDSLAADLARSLADFQPEESVDPLQDSAVTADLFRAAATFFNAKPWRVLDDESLVRIDIEGSAPVYGAVLGSAAVTYGLALFTDPDALHEVLTSDTGSIESLDSLSVTFAPQSEAPADWVALRHRRKWPLASPSAFPVPIARSNEEGSLPDDAGMRRLAWALRGVAALVAARGRQIKQDVPVVHRHPEVDEHGATRTVTVSWPMEDAFVTPEKGGGGSARPLDEMRSRALLLPDAREVIGRLAWSFFRNQGPLYLPAPEQDRALGRFVEWATFAARPSGRTLAERALEAAAGELGEEAMAERALLIRPRAGIFRVARVDRDVGVHLVDQITGEQLFARERLGTHSIRPGFGLIGLLYPVSPDAFVLGGDVLMYPEVAEFAAGTRPQAGEVKDFAPMIEEVMFGASEDWIKRGPAREVRRAYTAFRAALVATGTELPAYGELQVRIDETDKPLDIFRALGGEFEWWTDQEVAVMMAFVMRIWNLTPRREFGGKSPDAMARRDKRRS